MRLYIDACIWRDYWENRSDNFRPLGEWAFRLLQFAVNQQNSIVLSDLLFKELERHFSRAEVERMLQILPITLRLFVKSSQQQHKEAKRLARARHIPYGDVLHAILARDKNAIIITRDRHFEKLTDIVSVKKPEDLL